MSHELLIFFAKHWALSGLFVALLLALVWYEFYGQSGGMPQLLPQQAVSLMNQDKLIIVDLRAVEQFNTGHIINAKNIATADLSGHKFLNKHKTQTIMLVCAQGQQSTAAAQQLHKAGFTDVKVLRGGLQAWRAQNLPLTKS